MTNWELYKKQRYKALRGLASRLLTRQVRVRLAIDASHSEIAICPNCGHDLNGVLLKFEETDDSSNL